MESPNSALRPALLAPLAMVALLLSGCYSFTGASVPAHIHSIAIPTVEDVSGFGQGQVRTDLTDLLVQKFTQEGTLQVTNPGSADALLTATVTRVTDELAGVQANEQLTSRKLTLYIKAEYRDLRKQKTFWSRDFQQSAEYPIDQTLTGVQNALADAEEKLAGEIQLAVISNW